RPSTSPWPISCQQRAIELSGLRRRASAGFSSIPTESGAWTTLSRSAGWGPAAASSGSSTARSPTSTTDRSGVADSARRAPPTFGAGPWSPPIASSASRIGLLPLLGRFHVDHFAALVRPAVGAHPVRQDRLVALRAVLDLHRRHVVVTPAGALLRLGGASLGYGHVCRSRLNRARGKAGMLERPP